MIINQELKIESRTIGKKISYRLISKLFFADNGKLRSLNNQNKEFDH